MSSSRRFLLLLLSFALVVASNAAPPSELPVGQKVAAQWTDGNYYVGSVAAINGRMYRIVFEDGDHRPVEGRFVFPLRSDATFAVGEHVMAAWKGARMYPGTVMAVTAVGCRIRWDDGDKPMPVANDRIFRLNRP